MKNKIKEVRKQLNLTQTDLAERSGINRPYLSLIENGRVEPSIEVVLRIANSLGVVVNDIFFVKDVRNVERHICKENNNAINSKLAG